MTSRPPEGRLSPFGGAYMAPTLSDECPMVGGGFHYILLSHGMGSLMLKGHNTQNSGHTGQHFSY